jgi:hypothetical protein
MAIGLVGLIFLLTPAGWVASCALTMLLASMGPRALAENPVHGVAFTLLAGTLVTHAVFFGEPRFALVTYPWVLGLAGLSVRRPKGEGEPASRHEREVNVKT